MVELRPDQIRTDGGTQSRMALNPQTVDEYTEAMEAGDQFPPLDVYYDGEHYWLGDGFHRLEAIKRIGYEIFPVNVHQGTVRDAILHSVGANASHGLRRTNEDKRRAVTRLLKDPEWSQWSDREIGRRCRVSNRFVSNLRQFITPDDPSVNGTQIEKKVIRNGQEYTMNTAKIGKSQPAPAPAILSVWELESILKGWIGGLEEHPANDEFTILQAIKQGTVAGDAYLQDIKVHLGGKKYFRGDMIQAVNNLLEQRRQKKLAEAEAQAIQITPKRDDETTPGNVVVQGDDGTPYSLPEDLPKGVTAMTMRGHWYCGRCDKKYGPGIRYWVKWIDKPVCKECLDYLTAGSVKYTIFECPTCGQKKVQRLRGEGSPTHSCHACGNIWQTAKEFFAKFEANRREQSDPTNKTKKCRHCGKRPADVQGEPYCEKCWAEELTDWLKCPNCNAVSTIAKTRPNDDAVQCWSCKNEAPKQFWVKHTAAKDAEAASYYFWGKCPECGYEKEIHRRGLSTDSRAGFNQQCPECGKVRHTDAWLIQEETAAAPTGIILGIEMTPDEIEHLKYVCGANAKTNGNQNRPGLVKLFTNLHDQAQLELSKLATPA